MKDRTTLGVPVPKDHGAYGDVWVSGEGEWRLAYRETVMYGQAAATAYAPATNKLVY